MIDQEEIHKQCLSKNPIKSIKALNQLRDNFSSLPDKQQAWGYLHKLTSDEDYCVRYRAASTLGSAFAHMSDKQQAWNDLIKLTNDEYRSVRYEAASTLGSAFAHVPDKQQAWNDLHKLTNDEYSFVRYGAASALGSAFAHMPDKQQAWNDLHKLTNDEYSYVRHKAASALDSAFAHMPDKQQAWNDLHKLANNKDSSERYKAASTLGSAFAHVPDKQQAWNDLHKLTNDEDSWMRVYANHSLGKVSIFKASQAEKEEDYKEELEKAIEFFETAANESYGLYSLAQFCHPFYRSFSPANESYGLYSPAQFCLPFYRSFYTIIFKRQQAKEQVDKYLEEAKKVIGDSKSKELLFDAVKNLGNALKEVRNLENTDLLATQDELNYYRQYCDRAAELMIEIEESAPFAIIAMRKGLPILDRNLKELLEEIQKKAKIACKESKGTATEEIACAVSKEVQKWEIGSQEEMAFNLENLVFTLEANTPHNPQSNFILDRIKQIPEQKDVAKQYGMLNSIITLIIKSSSEQKLQEIGEKVDQISDKLEEITISLKPGISEELIIHIGPITQWGGIEYTMSIPLQDISYPELKEDLQKIVGKKIDKLSKMPVGLANKVRDYLIQKKMWSILDKLT